MMKNIDIIISIMDLLNSAYGVSQSNNKELKDMYTSYYKGKLDYSEFKEYLDALIHYLYITDRTERIASEA